jgi:hypothetical protein
MLETIPAFPPPLKTFREFIDGIIFDTWVPSVARRYNFFSEPAGQGGKKEQDTNMWESRIIPFSDRFCVCGFSAEIVPIYARISKGDGLTNLQRILNGVLSFHINNKQYLEMPLTQITTYSVLCSENAPTACLNCCAPITSFHSGKCAYCGTVYGYTFEGNGIGRGLETRRDKFKISNSYILTRGTPFWGEVSWDTPPTKSNNLGLRLYIHGAKERQVQ